MKSLVVDDREENLLYLDSILSFLGFEVVCARNGIEALEVLDREKIDLIVSDLLMPGMDGFRLCREVRLRPAFADIPFIIFSGSYSDARDSDFAHRLGATAFLIKPMEPVALRDAIQSIWQQHVECPAPAPTSIVDELEYLRSYNEIVSAKLDKNLADYAQLSNRLQGAFDEKVKEISHRMTVEGSLRQSEARGVVDKRRIEALAGIIDHSHDAVVICSEDDTICYWNKGAELLYGWTSTEVLGLKQSQLFARYNHTGESPLDKTYERGSFEGEFRHVTKDHREIFVLGRFTAIKDDDGDPCILVYYFDITERKQLEEQFLRAQRMESIGILAGGVAHDLNNILAPILLGIPVLRTRIKDKQGLSMLDTMESSATRGALIIRQILNFSRGLGSSCSVIQVRHLLREIAEIMNETFPRNIIVDTDIPRSLWLLNADATRLHQVFMNLCVNARDAMPLGGSLSIKGENIELDAAAAAQIQGARAGRFVRISIADTGMGMEPAVVAKIWDPFFTTKEAGKGTGLGLSTVRSIVVQHEGFITLDTQLETGTTFEIYLPASDSSEEMEKLTRKELPRGNNQLILVVDDEYALRQSCEDLLTTHGYRVLCAQSGDAALELLRQHPTDVQVLIGDLLMPGMTGNELISLVKGLRPEIATIAISGTIMTSRNSQNPPGVMADAFLNKPFSAEELLVTVHEVLGEARP